MENLIIKHIWQFFLKKYKINMLITNVATHKKLFFLENIDNCIYFYSKFEQIAVKFVLNTNFNSITIKEKNIFVLSSIKYNT